MVDQSAVLVANEFNLTIFKESWFEEHGILQKEEFGDKTVISPGLVRIPTPDFELVIVPNRFQMKFFPAGYESAQSNLSRVMGSIVRMLPHTPYVAMGLNFSYLIIPPAKGGFFEWNREVFGAQSAVSSVEKTDREPRFGAYFSVGAFGARIKVNALPIQFRQNMTDQNIGLAEGQDLMKVDCNCHADLVEPFEKPLCGMIDKWETFLQRTTRIAKALEG